MQTPGEMLKDWRTEKGLSQEKAAELVSVTQATWCDWEHDRKLPRIQQAIAIARVTRGKVSITCWEDSPAAKKATGTDGH